MKAAFFAYRKWAFGLYSQLPKQASKSIAAVYVAENFEKPAPKDAKVIDPKKISALAASLRKEKISTLLFIGWSWMVPKEITDEFTCVCLHPSPLPKYRGGSPLQNQIIAGEAESAVTLFKMTQGMDDGDIYEQEKISLEGELEDIFERMSCTGAKAITRMLSRFEKGNCSARKQDET
ncbi:MAG: formyltransferase family protein, partial [Candidatus Micrarchaeia archaeon]